MGTGSDIAQRLTLPSGAGVASLNSLTGPLVLTSTGGTVAITLVGSNINLEAAGSSVPGGALTSVQFNNGGAFGGFGTWDGTTFDVGSGKTLKTQSLIVNALTSGRIPFAGAGGAFTDNGSLLFNGTGSLTLGLGGTGNGVINIKGTTSGTITVQPQNAAGTYNWNWPITAGTTGQPLLSQGGLTNAMTFGTLTIAGGGTGTTSFSGGSNGVLFLTSGGVLSNTSGGPSNTVLHGNGSGAPSFSAVQPADCSGLGTITAGDIILGSTNTLFARLNAVATGSILVSNGAGAAPIYSNTPVISGDFKLGTVGKAFFVKEGAGGFQGQIALTAGVATVTITGLTTTDKAFVSRATASGTTLASGGYTGACTANTLTITAATTAGATQVLDTSIINYEIFRPA